MFAMTRSLLSGQRDASKRVAEARRFSVRLPLVGTVRVPPPDQLAFYGVLGGLAVLELIDWPVALAMGLGSALVARHFAELEQREEQLTAPAPRPSRRSRPPPPRRLRRKRHRPRKLPRRRPSRRLPRRKRRPRRPPPNGRVARKYGAEGLLGRNYSGRYTRSL